MRPITLTSHCQESSRLARKLVGGLLLFLLFHPTTTTLEIKNATYVEQVRHNSSFRSIHPLLPFVLCVFVLLSVQYLCVQVDM